MMYVSLRSREEPNEEQCDGIGQLDPLWTAVSVDVDVDAKWMT